MHILNSLLTVGVVILMFKMINIFGEFFNMLQLIIVLCLIQFGKYWVQLKYNVSDTLQSTTAGKIVYFSSIGALVIGIASIFFFKFWIVIFFPLAVLLLCLALVLSFVLRDIESGTDSELLDNI